MDASDVMVEKCSTIWGDIANIFVSNNSLRLPELFPEIPPPTDLSDGIQPRSTEAEDFSGCFLEANKELDALVSEWAEKCPDEISAEEKRTIELRRSAVQHATKSLGEEKFLNLVLHRVGFGSQHLLKMQDADYPNLNPNSNLNLNPPAPNCPVSQAASLQVVNNRNVVLYRNPDAKEARKERIAKRHLQRCCVDNHAASGSGIDGQKQEEPGLKRLLQRVLKKDDVGSLGRIVLPKKGAMDHLPDLESRSNGIVIAFKDLATSRIWNMRYRYLSDKRKYVLDNSGDFVKANGLQVEDFIVLYKDTKRGEYMIRPVKMPAEDMKPPSKRNKRYQSRP